MVVVYAPQDQSNKIKLWNDLTTIIQNHNSLSIVLGDFNEVRSSAERMGCTFDNRGADKFNAFIHNSGLCDIPMCGKRFTRMNRTGSKLSKIDRILVSQHYIDLWPNSHVLAPPREISDHSPLFLTNSYINFGPIPFKFYNSWLYHSDFTSIFFVSWADNVVQNSCHPAICFKSKLQFLKSRIKEWRFSVRHKEVAATARLRQKIDELDNKAEISSLSPLEIDSRTNLVNELTTLEHQNLKDLR
ncbi:cytochrome P450 [Artemisia annua]|uniref:Cytochrome P450 n=1 Tax=Artemisia annua TaxID=35608 RepID=A0A2U1LJT5_ARTAN|nr:cytochrome P450 [Artemisia annua]